MKRITIFLLSLMLLVVLPAVAAAHPTHSRHSSNSYRSDRDSHSSHPQWSHTSYSHSSWVHRDHRPLTFTWGERRDLFENRYERFERMDDHEWRHRFPGLQAYRWHSRGHHDSFFYEGRRITHGVLFFNHSDHLVGVGFMFNGHFVFVRDDHRSYRNHDSFFISWGNR